MLCYGSPILDFSTTQAPVLYINYVRVCASIMFNLPGGYVQIPYGDMERGEFCYYLRFHRFNKEKITLLFYALMTKNAASWPSTEPLHFPCEIPRS